MSSMKPEEFQLLLDQYYKWPAEYMFKFIIQSDLAEGIQQLEDVFDSLEIIEKKVRSSQGGNGSAEIVP